MADNLFTTTGEDQARLVSVVGESAVPGYKLTREWVYLDATVVDTLVVALKIAGSYSGPKADGQAYAGTFVNSSVKGDANIEDNDRQGRIRQELTLVQDLDDDTDLTAAVALYKYIDEEINHLTFETGTDPWVQSRQQLQMILPNVNPASLDNLTDRVTPTISNAQWEARAATLLSSQHDTTSAWEFFKLDVKQERDNTLTVVVTFNDPDFGIDSDATTGEDSKQTTTQTNTGGYGVTKTEVIRGKDITVANTLIGNMAADADRSIDRTNWNEGQPGEAIITKFQTLKDTPPTSQAPLLILEQSASGNLAAMVTATWFRVDTANEATLVAASKLVNNWNSWFPGKGYTTTNGFVWKDTRYNRNPNGTVDITSEIWVPQTKSFVGPDSEKKYCIRRSYEQTSSKRPTSVSASAEAVDGSFHRRVHELIKVIWTKSDNKAQDHARGGLNGSFSRFDRATGLFYAERIVDRAADAWTEDGRASITGPLDTGTSNQYWDADPADEGVVTAEGNCGEITNDK